MFGIGGTEFAIILIFAFLIFGPDKLPAIAKTVGQAIAKIREVQNEMNEVVKEEVYDPAKDKDNPFQRPLDKMASLDKREVKTETFAERKARHDRERAERQAAQAQAQAQAAGAEGAAAAVAKPASGAASDTASRAAAPAGKTAPAVKPRPKMSAVELYGMAPRKKAAPKASSASAKSASAEKPEPSSDGGHAPSAPSDAASSASANPAPSAGTPEGGE